MIINIYKRYLLNKFIKKKILVSFIFLILVLIISFIEESNFLKDSSAEIHVPLLLTLFITIMGLLSPIFIIHIFNRYIAFGLQGTLFFLLSGALAVAIFEFVFRNVRNKILCDILISPVKIFKLDLIKNFFERERNNTKRNLIEIIDFNNNGFNNSY